MRANGKYAAIARQSLKENQPETYSRLQAERKLESLLADLDRTAEAQISATHQALLDQGVQPGAALMEAESQAIRDLLLFPDQDEKDMLAES